MASSLRIYSSIISNETSRIPIRFGLVSFIICSTAIAGKYSSVLPGNPNTSVKSSSSTPSKEIGKKCPGVYGLLSLLYSAGRLFWSAYILNNAKSPVCLGQVQLSVSDPNFHIEDGGAATKRMS